MELRLLQSFLVLSEELHFGRAAARLFIAQPPLTKQIHRLEKELGVQLFERHPKGARLTPAGEVLAEEAREIFAKVEQAEHNVRNADLSGVGHLVLGASGTTGAALLPGMLRDISTAAPGVDLGVRQFENSAQVAGAIIDGDLDAGLIQYPLEHVELSTRLVSTHHPVLLVPDGHRLADRESVQVAEIVDEDFIIPRRYSGSAQGKLIEEVCATADFSPRVVQEVADAYSVLVLVAGNQGVSISVNGVDAVAQGVRAIPFADEDLPTLRLAIAWRKKNPSVLLQTAVDAVAAGGGDEA